MRKKQLFILTFLLVGFISQSQVKLPLFFADSMVLQRNTNASVWGTDVANRKIIVTGSWGVKDSVVSNSTGIWKLKINTPNAGGPFTLTINGSTTVLIKDVYIGEVWLCSGQSNMEMPMKGYTSSTPPQTVDSANFFIANSLNPNLRVYMSGWNGTSRIPVSNLTLGKWETASPATTPDFSALAYFFGRKIQAALGIPVGLIVTARGGATIESWMDSTSLATIKPVVIPSIVNWQDAQATPTILYNTMLYPFIGYTIKGIIWAQGEANRSNHAQYRSLLTTTIQSWRDQWQLGDFPFYFTQLAPNGTTSNASSARVREAQLNTMMTVNATGMATTMDIGVQGMDHYPKKKIAGDRLAEWVLIRDYGRTGTPSGPVLKSMSIKNDTINLRFDYTGTGLTAFGSGFQDFEIAGANKVFVPATATIADFGYSINVRSSSVTNPLFVNYAFKDYVEGSVFNRAGLPASSFRTENIFAVLPVTFGKIDVVSYKDFRILTWQSLVEINIEDYEVQVSTNGNEFKSVGKVAALGTSINYSFKDDTKLETNVVYYRLKAINKNGLEEYSKIVKATVHSMDETISILNPSTHNLQLFFNKSFTGTILIANNLGKTIAIKQVSNHIGGFSLLLPKWFKGLAFVSFINSNKEKKTKLITII